MIHKLIYSHDQMHSISGGREVGREDLVRLPALGVGGRNQRGRGVEAAESATGQLDGVGQRDVGLGVGPIVARSVRVVCKNSISTLLQKHKNAD